MDSLCLPVNGIYGMLGWMKVAQSLAALVGYDFG